MMGNTLCGAGGSAAVKPAVSKQTSNLSRRSAQSTSSGGEQQHSWPSCRWHVGANASPSLQAMYMQST